MDGAKTHAPKIHPDVHNFGQIIDAVHSNLSSMEREGDLTIRRLGDTTSRSLLRAGPMPGNE